MAYRKFKGIQYPVPGVDTAINILRPGARWNDELYQSDNTQGWVSVTP